MAEDQLSDAMTRIREAATKGETPVVESLLAFVASDIGPVEADAAAREALTIAATNRKRTLASYLTDFLADTERVPPMEGGEDSEPFDILAAARDTEATQGASEPAGDDGKSELITVFICPCQLPRLTQKPPAPAGGAEGGGHNYGGDPQPSDSRKVYPAWHILGGGS
jgi:hypothetical protein